MLDREASPWKMVPRTHDGRGWLYNIFQPFDNTTLRVVFKTTRPNDNSGFYIRMPEQPADPWYGVHNGCEVQIDAARDDCHCTVAIYSLNKVSKRVQKTTGDWNTMDVTGQGPGDYRISTAKRSTTSSATRRFPRECIGMSPCAVLGPMLASSACRATTAGRRRFFQRSECEAMAESARK